MKTSLLLSLLILAAGALLGWKRHGDLITLREVHTQVAEEARALGLEPEKLAAAGQPPPRLKSDRGGAADKVAEARSFAGELIAFVKEMKEIEKSGEPPDAETQQRIMKLLGRFMDLSPAQIKTVIDELKDSPELDDKTRREIVGLSIMMLANEHPEAALAVFTETSDMAGMADMGSHVVSSSLGKWAEKDPFGALEWVRKNSEKHSDLITDEAKAAIVAGAARQDPKLALSLLREVDLKETHQQVGALVRSLHGAEERDSLLAALRADKKHADLLKPVLSALGGRLVGEGFETSQAWLSSANLSESETADLAEGLSPWRAMGDTGRWIEWMADKLPEQRLDSKVGQMVEQWTRDDYQAAGEWINTAPEGPARQAAVKSYAKTLSSYEPEAAAQWALTLPVGKDRDDLLHTIHGEWKKQDEAAAADFARQQGIGE